MHPFAHLQFARPICGPQAPGSSHVAAEETQLGLMENELFAPPPPVEPALPLPALLLQLPFALLELPPPVPSVPPPIVPPIRPPFVPVVPPPTVPVVPPVVPPIRPPPPLLVGPLEPGL